MIKKTTACIVALVLASVSLLPAQTRELPQRKQLDQDRDFRLPTRKSLLDKNGLDLLRQKKAQIPFDLETQALEGAIDPDSYVVGPGDAFLITIWSALENSIPAQVSPSGKLIIATIGAIDVDGKSLTEVQTLVTEAAGSKYRNSTVSVNLARVRQIRVHVTGQVMQPGPYEALAVHRVSDLIAQAGGLTSWAFERGVEIRHLDGSHDNVDLHKYTKLGDLQANLPLRGGDVVHVPAIDLKQGTVHVEGTVNDPGAYQLAQGETITDFLLRVDALTRRADLSNIYVERKGATNGQVDIIPVFPYLNGQSNGHAELALQDGDVVKVPQRKEDVYVIGAVQQPGTYPYVPGLTAQDYLGFAGAMFQANSPDKARVYRHDSDIREKGKDVPVGPGDTVFVPKKQDFGIREVAVIVGQASSLLIALRAIDAL